MRSGMRAEDLIVSGTPARSASQVTCSSFQEGHVDSGSSTGRLGLARLISLPSCSSAGGFSDRPCSAVFHDPLVEVDGSAGRLGSARLISPPSCPRSRTSGSLRQGRCAVRDEAEVTVSVRGDSSRCGFSRRLTDGHFIAHGALDDATSASHFTRTSSTNFVSPSVPSFVSPSVSVSGVGGQTTNSCWLTMTSSTSALDKVGRPASENRSSSGRIFSPRTESKTVHVEVQRSGSEIF